MAAGIEAISARNPFYARRALDWTLMRDAYGGERYIKEKGEQYLPPTGQMRAEGMAFRQPGFYAYQAYRTRAVYHELVKPALMAMLGVMHRRAPEIELPPALDSMRKNACFGGEGLWWLLQKINEQQMLMGRYGLLLDVATDQPVTAMPYICGYDSETIINWDSSKRANKDGPRQTQLVVLNESAAERMPGSLMWQDVERYRVLGLSDALGDIWDLSGQRSETYVAASIKNSTNVTSPDFIAPAIGGTTLSQIPFVFVGPRDLNPEPDAPVLMPLARIALTIYREEADYQQSLYMQGQDTLVVMGQLPSTSTNRQTMGAFGSIELPKGADAKFIGAESDGIPHQATAIQNNLKRAAQLGAQLLTERGNEAEAGEALAIRVASRTATLTTVAQVGGNGLEQILRSAAVWKGADPDKVKVAPNMDFADDPALAQDTVYMQTAKNMGLPLSKRSLHDWLRKREFTSMTFEQELKEIEKDGPAVFGVPIGSPAGASGRGVEGKPAGFPGGEGNDDSSKQK